jgi:hypothetical protein
VQISKYLATLLLLIVLSGKALAAPTFLYGFSVTSFSCDKHPYISCSEETPPPSEWIEPLKQLTVGVSIDAVFDRYARLAITAWNGGKNSNQGFHSFDASIWGRMDDERALYGDLDLSESALAGYYYDNYIFDISFEVSRFLTGKLYINNIFNELFMETQGSNLWVGFIRSDWLGESSSILEFTGEWKFTRVVSEPGTLLLLLSAALAAVAINRKQLRQSNVIHFPALPR